MEVGDYVRLKYANRTYIRQIKSIYSQRSNVRKKDTLILDRSFEGSRYSILSEQVLDYNSDIKELIKIGDVIRYIDEYGNILVRDVHNTAVMYDIKQKNIKVLSIITSEEFIAREYEVILSESKN